MEKSVAKVYPFEHFLDKLHISEKYNGIQLSRIKRVNDVFVVTGGRVMAKFWMILFAVDLVCGAIKLRMLIMASRIDEAQEFVVVFGFASLMILRGITVYRTQGHLVALLNIMYRMYPKTVYMQQRMQIPKYIEEYDKRFNFLHRGSTLGMLNFVAMPLCKFFMSYQWDGSPLLDQYHMVASWWPFGIKDKLIFYPLCYLHELTISINGCGMVLTWDRNFSILVTQLRLHFEYLGTRISEFDATHTTDPAKETAFLREFRECVTYFQILNGLVDEVDDIFRLSILISDILLALSVCLHMYLMINTSDVMSIVIFLMPCILQIFIIFDVNRQAAQLKEVTNNITVLLYSHNWPDATPEYRKCVLMWLQHASVPHKITGYMFDVGMEHFQGTMTLTYQLLTFLQSRQ